jgi:Protein of unknown function (DUF3631)
MSDNFTLNVVPITKQSWAVILQSDDAKFIHQINLLNAKARQDFINRSRPKFMHIPRDKLTAELNKLAAELISAEIEANTHGKNIDLSAPQPWPDPVDSAEVLNQISQTLSRNMVLPVDAADAIALWAAHTHCFQAFSHTPRLHISSPLKQCGKTTLLKILDCLVAKPFRIANVKDKAAFRVVEQFNPTVLIDEADSFICDNEELCDILVTGHERDSCIIRCVGYEKELRAFDVFSPAVISGIGPIPGVLQDRSISIRLFRAKPGELRQRFDSRNTDHVENLRRKLARLAADHFQRIIDCNPTLPPGAYNRLADNWRPLFAIAEIAGSDWPDRARAAFAALVDQREDDQDLGVMLLADIHQIFTEQGIDRIPSAGLVQALNAMADRPWSEANKDRPVSQVWLARKLAAFDIYPSALRVQEKIGRGYFLTAFRDAFERYLPQHEKSTRNSVTTSENIAVSSTSQSVTSTDSVTDQKSPEPLEIKPLLRCCASNAQNEGLKANSEQPQPQSATSTDSVTDQKSPEPLQIKPLLRCCASNVQNEGLKVKMEKPQPKRTQQLCYNPWMRKGLPRGTAAPISKK